MTYTAMNNGRFPTDPIFVALATALGCMLLTKALTIDQMDALLGLLGQIFVGVVSGLAVQRLSTGGR